MKTLLPNASTLNDAIRGMLTEAKIAPSTRRFYRYGWQSIANQIMLREIVKITPGDLFTLVDAWRGKPGTHNAIVALLKRTFKWAIRNGLVSSNPAQHLCTMPTGSWHRWEESEIQQFKQETFSPRMNLALDLALYTGQRESDILSLRFSQINLVGGTIEFEQQKTGTRLVIPIHPALKKRLIEIYAGFLDRKLESGSFRNWAIYPDRDIAEKEVLTHAHLLEATQTNVLANVPFRNDEAFTAYKLNPTPTLALSASAFRAAFNRHLKKIGLEDRGLVFHGLRKSAISRLIESGCTAHEAAAISGHKSIRSLEIYVQIHQQKQMAEGALKKMLANPDFSA